MKLKNDCWWRLRSESCSLWFRGESAETYREPLSLVLKEVSAGDIANSGIIILSDIAGGTPSQSAAYLSKDFKIGLISGMNMPILLTLALERNEKTTLEELIEKVNVSSTVGVKATIVKKRREKTTCKT